MAPPYILRPCPLITPRIDFKPAPPPALPTLSTRVEYNPEFIQLKRQHIAVIEEEPRTPKKSRHRRSCTPAAIQSGMPGAISDDNTNRIDYGTSDEDEDDVSGEGGRQLGSSQVIAKPQGEPGRPGAGGFNLDAALLEWWPRETVEEFLRLIKTKAREKLDPTRTFSKQNKDKIQDICNDIQTAMPYLALTRFKDSWPVIVALKAHLKYRAEYSRRTENKATVERLRSAAQGA